MYKLFIQQYTRSISLLDKIAIFLCTGDPLINATGEHVTGILCGPIAQWSEYSHGLRGVLGSSPGRVMYCFLPCDSWWLSVGPCSGCEQQRDCLVGSGMAPSSLGDESIQAGELVTGLLCGPIAQWSEYSHGLRGVLGSSPGRVMC